MLYCLILKKSETHASDFFVKLRLTILVLAITITIANAQHQNKLKQLFAKTIYDSNYVESHYNALHVTLVGISRNHLLEIYDRTTNTRFNFRPNNAANFGIGLDYKFLTIELTKAFDLINQPDPKKGSSESVTLRLGFTGRKLLGSLLIQAHQGMYLSNPTQIYPNWNTSINGYPNRPDILSVVLFGSLYYNFNPSQYSTMASLWQIDRQKKSAGGILTGITVTSNGIYSDSALANTNQLSTLDPGNKIISVTNSLVGINLGYGYNLIWKQKIFANAMVIPGVNVQTGKYEKVDGLSYTFAPKLGFHGDLRLILGYNGENYYYGIHYANYAIQSRIQNDLNINLFNSYLRFFIGKRFYTKTRRK